MSTVISSHNLPSIRKCVDYAHYCQTRATVGLGAVPEKLFNEIKYNVVACFSLAFNAAIINDENISSDGSLNWNFIEADIWMDLSAKFDDEEIEAVMDVMFEIAADTATGDRVVPMIAGVA